MLNFNATLLAQIINFLILVAILVKVAYKPLMKTLAERQEKIAGSLEAAEKERAEAENLRLEYQQQMAQARTQAQEIVDKATKLAEQNKEEILAEARAEHARMLKAAQEEIQREKEQALSELKNEVVALSLTAAGKIVGQNLDAAVNSKLIRDFIDQLDSGKLNSYTN
ncbi:atpase f0 complex subunit b/b' bacterial/chloroplast [Lucifera butyrica]|uniref:ATP synthase subunit b n=1 Tax=Lucifera butyrica TaxID=1351585 RepID=A0A498RCF3_9FIRM|nr:F0F1 ATP synthase subunit B [Lucifera butyrica]VBB08929.1 atpase f0 complex subunit b/b' bacterial/chloroplast [Lucifera butyrica]